MPRSGHGRVWNLFIMVAEAESMNATMQEERRAAAYLHSEKFQLFYLNRPCLVYCAVLSKGHETKNKYRLYENSGY